MAHFLYDDLSIGVYHSSDISNATYDFDLTYYNLSYYSASGYGYLQDLSGNYYYTTAEMRGANLNVSQDTDVRLDSVEIYIYGVGVAEFNYLNLYASNYRATSLDQLASQIARDMVKGDDFIFGSRFDDFLFGEGGDDDISGLDGSDYIDGGSGIDTATFFGSRGAYSLRIDSSARIVVIKNNGDRDVLANIEFVEFYSDSITMSRDEIFASTRYMEIGDHITGSTYTLPGIKDFDGNFHGLNSSDSQAASSYKFHGRIDANGDGTKENIYTNKSTGRWVTASVDQLTGLIDFSQNASDGTTRIVGIYIDPLVDAGLVIQGSDHDSQRRFQNDLLIDNLTTKVSGDYDGDGFQEVYWKTNDGTAYLRALMHADGNIQYANYQSEQQMTDYLTGNGYGGVVSDIV